MASPVNTSMNEKSFFFLFVFLIPGTPRRVGYNSLVIRASGCMGLPGSDSKQGRKIEMMIKWAWLVEMLSWASVLSTRLFLLIVSYSTWLCISLNSYVDEGALLCVSYQNIAITVHPRNPHLSAMQRHPISLQQRCSHQYSHLFIRLPGSNFRTLDATILKEMAISNVTEAI